MFTLEPRGGTPPNGSSYCAVQGQPRAAQSPALTLAWPLQARAVPLRHPAPSAPMVLCVVLAGGEPSEAQGPHCPSHTACAGVLGVRGQAVQTLLPGQVSRRRTSRSWGVLAAPEGPRITELVK